MLRHTIFMALSTALRLLTGVVIFIVMARMWGPERFGSFMYLFTITSLVGLIVDYGFGQQLMRDIGYDKNKTRHIMSGVLAAKLLLSVGVVAVSAIVSVTPWGASQPVGVFWILLATCIASSFAETYTCVFRGLGQYQEETRIAAWVNFLHFGAVLALLFMDYGVTAVALGFLTSRILFLILTLRTYRRIAPVTQLESTHGLRVGLRNLRAGLPFAAEAGFTNFQSQADTLIVHHFLGPAAVGIYQAGLRLMQGANTFAQVLSNVYLPPMASKTNDAPALKHLANRLFIQMLLLGAGSLLVFGFGATLITHTLYGNKFQDLSKLMPLFGLLLLFRYIAASHGVTLSAVGLQSTRVAAITAALIALFTSAYFLLPRYQLPGMLYASIIAIACLYVVYALNLVSRGFPLGINKLNGAAFAAVLGVALFLISGI
ncbi:oligosaccharide flippase family protein [uncultured Rhodoferax sp.]|uniref:oligosaccharide flippase family protein n=1 Tax=uncultured Rhodoferax sp. TaxID=223188 RepID=UPI0025DDEA59|nr:oligosaccharide flippase family protein [uncultured Rhodoferax sp.]